MEQINIEDYEYNSFFKNKDGTCRTHDMHHMSLYL